MLVLFYLLLFNCTIYKVLNKDFSRHLDKFCLPKFCLPNPAIWNKVSQFITVLQWANVLRKKNTLNFITNQSV